jgi:hypothetical protein
VGVIRGLVGPEHAVAELEPGAFTTVIEHHVNDEMLLPARLCTTV